MVPRRTGYCAPQKFYIANLRSPKDSGFTLLELIVNVAIIGILAAIAIPAYTAFREKAKIAQAKSDLHTIQLAIEQLANDTNQWPGPSDAAQNSSKKISDLNSDDAGLTQASNKFSNWKGPYMKSVPKDSWGMDYFFDGNYTMGATKHAVIGSFGPNKCCQNASDSDDIILKLTQ